MPPRRRAQCPARSRHGTWSISHLRIGAAAVVSGGGGTCLSDARTVLISGVVPACLSRVGGMCHEDRWVALGCEDRQGRFDDVMLLVGDQLVQGSVYRPLADHGDALFSDEYFADLFKRSGTSPTAPGGPKSPLPRTRPHPDRHPDPNRRHQPCTTGHPEPAPRSRGLGHRLTRPPTASSTSADEQHRTAQHHFWPTNHTGNPIQRGHYISGVLGQQPAFPGDRGTCGRSWSWPHRPARRPPRR